MICHKLFIYLELPYFRRFRPTNNSMFVVLLTQQLEGMGKGMLRCVEDQSAQTGEQPLLQMLVSETGCSKGWICQRQFRLTFVGFSVARNLHEHVHYIHILAGPRPADPGFRKFCS